MAIAHRGETAFSAGGRGYYLVYGTREIAEMQSALGFHRPDPFAPVTWEEVEQKDGKKIRVELTWAERNQRMLTAFDGTFTNPGPGDLRKMVQIGLRRWEKANASLSDAEFEAICDGLGLEALRCGLTHAEFWDLTPREVALVIRSANERTLDSLDIAISGAWHGAHFAALAAVGKFPELGEVLERMRGRRKRTPQGTLERFDAWMLQVKAATGAIKP